MDTWTKAAGRTDRGRDRRPHCARHQARHWAGLQDGRHPGHDGSRRETALSKSTAMAASGPSTATPYAGRISTSAGRLDRRTLLYPRHDLDGRVEVDPANTGCTRCDGSSCICRRTSKTAYRVARRRTKDPAIIACRSMPERAHADGVAFYRDRMIRFGWPRTGRSRILCPDTRADRFPVPSVFQRLRSS